MLLSSLLESWYGLVMALSNSSSSSKLKFDDVVGVIFSEEIRRKSLRDSSMSGSALNMDKGEGHWCGDLRVLDSSSKEKIRYNVSIVRSLTT